MPTFNTPMVYKILCNTYSYDHKIWCSKVNKYVYMTINSLNTARILALDRYINRIYQTKSESKIYMDPRVW